MINGIKIFDCFKFFTEKELLHLRFMEYYDVVDYFVIVEATKTQTGLPHTPIFKSLKPKFEKYLDKVIHVVVEDMPGFSKDNIWVAENFQRNCILRGLKDIAKEGDAIIVSDCDEFWNRDKVKEFVGKPYPIVFIHSLFHFYMNAKRSYMWRGSCYAPYGLLTPQEMRNYSRLFRGGVVTKTGNYHYSALGGAATMQVRANSLCEGDPNMKINFEMTSNSINNLLNLEGQIGILVGQFCLEGPKSIKEFRKLYPNLFFSNYYIMILSHIRKIIYKLKIFFNFKLLIKDTKTYLLKLFDLEVV